MALARFSCICSMKELLSKRISFIALIEISLSSASFTVRFVQVVSADDGSSLVMQRHTIDLQP